MPMPLPHRLPRGDRRALALAGTTLTALALAALPAAHSCAQAAPGAPSTGPAPAAGAGPSVALSPPPAAAPHAPMAPAAASAATAALSNAAPTAATTAAAPVAPPMAAPAAVAAPPAAATTAPGQPPARATTKLAAAPATAFAAPIPLPNADADLVLEAREALRRRDRERLAATRNAAMDVRHPLAVWLDYWELGNRLAEVQQDELDAFYARWPGSYLEDRLRNDWLLELGRRRDWERVRAEYPRFQLRDDREAACYALLARFAANEDVRAEGRAAWLAQREADDGCNLLAATLRQGGHLPDADVWRKARLSVEAGRNAAARQAVTLIDVDAAVAVAELAADPQRYLKRKAATRDRRAAELTTLALIRAGAADPDAAARLMEQRWAHALPPAAAAWVWASLGRQSAQKLAPEASEYFQKAELRGKGAAELALPDDTLAWKARAALRANDGAGRWQQVAQAINAMSEEAQREPVWAYWKARALQALATDSQDGAAMVAEARELLSAVAGPLPHRDGFYGKLALEELKQPLRLPPRPQPPSAQERAAAAALPGLRRALLLIDIGLRSEGVREWNYSVRGLGDRELLAAAQLACEREVWDRCINTSERTRELVDMPTRFPMPFRQSVVQHAKEAGIDPAYVYGLIRQESRFVMDARSGVGASGLMQLMPATAKWTARKLGIDYARDRITDRDTNLRIGTGYLKLVLDSFDGSQALAAAGYNAGPNRPRKWREGPTLDAAAWAENIPFAETRDYVKKVLSNATDYAALLGGDAPSLRSRLGASVGPRSAPLDAVERELP